MFPAKSDIEDGAGHALVTAYALKRPDGQWSLLIVNRDQQNAHRVRILFQDKTGDDINSFAGPVEIATFGKAQYQWHSATTRFMPHAEHAAERAVVANTKGMADPDGPIVHTRQTAGRDASYDLPAASVVVIGGKIGTQ